MSAAALITAVTGAANSLFGGQQNTSGSTRNIGVLSNKVNAREVGTKSASSSGFTQREMQLDDEAIARIIEQTLGGAGGLAEIFGGEQNIGLYNSSVSAQAAGDLASKLVGELALITAKEVETTAGQELGLEQAFASSTQEQKQEQATTSKTEVEEEGLLKRIFG